MYFVNGCVMGRCLLAYYSCPPAQHFAKIIRASGVSVIDEIATKRRFAQEGCGYLPPASLEVKQWQNVCGVLKNYSRYHSLIYASHKISQKSSSSSRKKAGF